MSRRQCRIHGYGSQMVMNTYFTAFLLIAPAFMVLLAVIAWQRRTIPGALHFCGLCLCLVVYFIGYALELHASTLQEHMFRSLLQYVGIPFFPAFWGLLAVAFMRRQNPGRLLTVSLFLVPLATVGIRLTDPLHGLVYRSVSLDTSGATPLFLFVPGPWYWVHVAYINVMLLVAALCFIRATRDAQPLYRSQARLMLMASTVPWAGFLLYLLGATPRGLDTNPLFVFVAVVLLGWGLFRKSIFKLAPLARSILFKQLHDPVLVFDANRYLIDCNRAAHDELGLSVVAEVHAEQALLYLHGLYPLLVAEHEPSDAYITWDDRERGKTWQISRTVLTEQNLAKGYMVIMRDVSGVIDSERRLSAMRIAQHREEERLAIARDLHDDLAQGLAALHMELAFLSRIARDGDVAGRLARLKEEMGGMVGMVRTILAELRSQVLEERGLEGGLRWLCDNLYQRCAIPCHCTITLPSCTIPPPVAIAAYRIVQEALINVARHSQATTAWLSVEAAGGLLLIRISDNGVGMADSHGTGSDRKFGLAGMKERAELCGGLIDISEEPGGGVAVHAKLPLSYKEEIA